jgi:polyisoprenoid-binding protein YceI
VTKPWTKLALAAALGVVLLATAGTWLYLNVFRDDAPERLTLREPSGGAASSTTTAAAAGAGDEAAGAGQGVDGTWTVAAGSQAGYRVQEVLFGQSATAVGRTEDVTGEISVVGSRVASGSFTVDMTTVRSDESRRDNQFRGRIMDVASYPKSTFRLTSPVEVGRLPADGEAVTVEATGELTLRGTTRPVTFDLEAQRSGPSIRVAGSIPIVFEEWGIPNPSFGPAETEDNGELEFLLVLSRQG